MNMHDFVSSGNDFQPETRDPAAKPLAEEAAELLSSPQPRRDINLCYEETERSCRPMQVAPAERMRIPEVEEPMSYNLRNGERFSHNGTTQRLELPETGREGGLIVELNNSGELSITDKDGNRLRAGGIGAHQILGNGEVIAQRDQYSNNITLHFGPGNSTLSLSEDGIASYRYMDGWRNYRFQFH